MSTLSERLARLRASGNAPAAASSGTESKPETGPDSARRTSRTDTGSRLEDLRRRNRKTAGGASSRPGTGPIPPKPSETRVGPDTAPPGEGWVQLGEFAWEKARHFPPILPEKFTHPFVLPEGGRTRDLVFYDLETTGLSGGTGNTAFLIGIGCQDADRFVVRQLFLADYPGEECLLRRFLELSGDAGPQVSYNGRSFDSQVLKTRFLLNRMQPPQAFQADLLYPSRRLWRGVLDNLNLRTLETRVLDFHREDDLPGSEAPDAWFEWLAGDRRRIEGVFRHNADDIVSLARLLLRLEEWGLVNPECCADTGPVGHGSGVDGGETPGRAAIPAGAVPSAWGMARQWSGRDAVLEESWLIRGMKQGERRCALELAHRRRRQGRVQEAREIWEAMNRTGRDRVCAVELAKYWEHREKNYRRALELLAPLEGLPLSAAHRRDLDHRRRRLLRKIGFIKEEVAD